MTDYLPTIACILLGLGVAYAFTRHNRREQNAKPSPWEMAKRMRRSPSAETMNAHHMQIGIRAFRK